MSKTIEEINALNQLMFETDICKTKQELSDILEDLEQNTKNSQKEINKKKNINEPNIEKREIGNFTIYIGKNHKQNDYLYSKVSSPEDIWFHVLNTPGAHIIAKNNVSSEYISGDTLLRIAKLAKEFSTAKNATKASVVYTLRKFVKRPQNTKSGFVVYKNEIEIVVN